MDSIPGSGGPPGGGNSNPLQHCCLENSMSRGAWRATINGIAKSRTWLSDSAGTHATWGFLCIVCPNGPSLPDSSQWSLKLCLTTSASEPPASQTPEVHCSVSPLALTIIFPFSPFCSSFRYLCSPTTLYLCNRDSEARCPAPGQTLNEHRQDQNPGLLTCSPGFFVIVTKNSHDFVCLIPSRVSRCVIAEPYDVEKTEARPACLVWWSCPSWLPTFLEMMTLTSPVLLNFESSLFPWNSGSQSFAMESFPKEAAPPTVPAQIPGAVAGNTIHLMLKLMDALTFSTVFF